MARRLSITFAALALWAHAAAAQTKIVFGTDWLAEAEHGGFYQALAKGFYKAHGLDMTIKQGGPQTNPPQQVALGLVDIQISSGSFAAMAMVQQSIPVVAVAAFFQKDPEVLISHPGAGSDTIAAMKGKPIMISAANRTGSWLFLKAKYGFTDDQIRPYNFSVLPFLADPKAIEIGFVSSEPYQVEKALGAKPVVNLLADNGYDSYSNVLLVRSSMVQRQPGAVRAFIEASVEGWQSYLQDPAAGDALIHRDNPDISQDVLDNSVKVMRQYGIVDSGDSRTMGLGAMTQARWKGFFDTMVGAGLYKPDLDWQKAFTLQFVDHGYGLATK